MSFEMPVDGPPGGHSGETDSTMHYILDHIFFIPKILQPRHSHEEEIQATSYILKELKSSIEIYVQKLPIGKRLCWERIGSMIEKMTDLYSYEDLLVSKRIQENLRKLSEGDSLALLLRRQNAGILIRVELDKAIFEMFEVSPYSKAVLDTSGRLCRSFPGPIYSVPIDTFQSPAFQKELAVYLASMDREHFPRTCEEADAGPADPGNIDPMMVIHGLGGILHAVGRPYTNGTRISKRIGDDCVYQNSTIWRRSPLWLVLRVAIQTTVVRQYSTGSSQKARREYKSFMAYFLCRLLKKFSTQLKNPEAVHFMIVKLARRFHKIGPELPDFVINTLSKTIANAAERLSDIWNSSLRRDVRKVEWLPGTVAIDEDCNIQFKNIKPYIQTAMHRRQLNHESITPFQPNHPRRFGDTLRDLERNLENSEIRTSLNDIEQWVATKLKLWVKNHSGSLREMEQACMELASFMNEYFHRAIKIYANNPEEMSIAHLTALEIWIALDKLAIKICPFFKDYHPEVDLAFFGNFLLPRLSELERLKESEGYVQRRLDRRKRRFPRILSDRYNDENCFGVRYFDESPHLQKKEKEIRKEAINVKKERKAELRDMNKAYFQKMDKASTLQCSKKSTSGGIKRHYVADCEKCRIENECKKMNITKFEWPLPEDEFEMKMVLFELDLPPWFAAWRDTTIRLLADTTAIIKYGEDDKRLTMQQTLKDYIPLTSHYIPRGSTVLCSRAKAAQTTQVPTVKFPCKEEEVIFPHQLKYKLYYAKGGPDINTEGNWVSDYLHKSFGTKWKPQLFVYKLREPYKCLEFAMGTNHTTNEVLANQASASKDISLQEFYSFGALRAGLGIQWLNMWTELRTRLLTFSSEAVHNLFLQAAWQVGPTVDHTDLYRIAHRPLNRIEFSAKLLDTIDSFISHVEENWMEITTASTLVVLTLRILVFAKDPDIKGAALVLLLRLRTVVYRWITNHKEQARNAESEEEMSEIMQRILHASAVCRMSFDVDDEHFDTVFDLDGLAIYLECGVLICDNKLTTYENSYISILLDRDIRLAHRMERQVRDRILADRTAIDNAVKRLWSDYQPVSVWKVEPEPNERWLQTKTKSTLACRGQNVSFNILEGNLLINNVPLGRLPRSYTEDLTFKRLFGQSILSVGPSDDPKMRFQSVYKSHGYTVYFALVQDKLIIRLKGEHELLELIPLSVFQGEIPQPLINSFFHFVDLATGVIELRPENGKWVSSERNWRIQIRNGNIPSKVVKGYGGIELVNPQSRTVEMVNNIFSRLEDPSQILVTSNKSGVDGNPALIIELPRMNLEFFNNAGNLLQCGTLQDMVVDSDQDCGTLVGLKDKLVLRHADDTTRRMVIIPYGDVNIDGDTRHLKITILTEDSMNLRPYLAYQIDSRLSRLVDNGSFVSRLYQILLHAHTSSPTCRADPLTGRSGAEEALYLLDCAASKSFHTLGDEEIRLLDAISDLTPRRERNDVKGAGQIVYWHKQLPFTTQRVEFALKARSVLEYWSRLRSLRPRNNSDEKEVDLEVIAKHGDEDLLLRAVIAQARFYSAWSTETPDGQDSSYVSRDHHSNAEEEDGSKAAQVYKVARMIYEWDCSEVRVKLLEIFKQDSWKPLNGIKEEFNLVQDRQLHEDHLKEYWCSLYTALRKCKKEDCYRVMFCLSALALRSTAISHDMVCGLVAVATEEVFKHNRYALPNHSSFNLTSGISVTEGLLKQIVSDKEFKVAYDVSEEAELPRENNGENEDQAGIRRQRIYKSNLRSQLENVAGHYVQQWPTTTPNAPTSAEYPLVRVPKLHKKVLTLFKNIYKNFELSRTVERIQAVFDGLQKRDIPRPAFHFLPAAKRIASADTIATFLELFDDSERTPQRVPDAPAVLSLEDFPSSRESIEVANERENELLVQLTEEVQMNGFEFSTKYAQDLQKSVESLKLRSQPFDTISTDLDNLEAYARAWGEHVGDIFEIISEALAPKEEEHLAMASAGLWPKITPVSVITQLNHRNIEFVPEGWRNIFIKYGKAIVQCNRADRLVQLAKLTQIQELMQELENVGYRKFSANDHPEWLLLEIANHMIIRDVQADIAQAMLSPPLGSNAVMQLNMGEGKSSVIVPMIASTIANGEQLARVVVLKPLLREMFNLLTSKLGNICGRRIFHLPFSRNIEVYESNIESIRGIYEECIKERGILLVRPEDILSFKLIGLEKLCADSKYAQDLLDVQKWLEKCSRDILDESDEILATKYQLIYTVGAREPMEGSPSRWNIIEEVLGLAASKAREVFETYPNGLEFEEKKPSAFPYLRILDDQAGDELLTLLAQAICKSSPLSTVPLYLQPSSTREAIYQFITERNVDNSLLDIIKKNNNDDLWRGVLLLRGLFAMGLLKFALKEKRYRVDYGHDFSRTRLAAPFKAKDVPGQADFAQPDVLVLLSCLSYYYSGLSEEEIIECFRALSVSDSPVAEYENWIQECQDIPKFLKELKGVNIEDSRQRREYLIPIFNRNKYIIDFYMNTCVFPKEAKQFPEKLSTSGWDVAAAKSNLTSGFSGTCDNRYLLPLSIEQLDMDTHTHTNALVLRYLLQRENNSFISLSKGEMRMTTGDVLDMIVASSPKISILLDVGAQILELNNIEVAKLWLSKVAEKQAAVFFNDEHELSVIDRDGRVELLMVSSYAKQLNKCLVYLDDAHTRGTDLKLPLRTRGVVTIGPGTTKDRLLQGCMRLRKLGYGQSVAFAAPSEIERAILECAEKMHASDIETVDILRWSMMQSCKQTVHNLGLWAAQGVDYIKRERAWTEFNRVYEDTAEDLEVLRRELLEEEHKSLEDLYNVSNESASSLSAKAHSIVDPRIQEIIARCRNFGLDKIVDLPHEEEQEREVAQEIEVETEVERPPPANAMEHVIHEHFKKFLSSGSIPRDSEYFIPVFKSLLYTSIGHLVKKNAFTSRLLVTQDFVNTVELRAQDAQDDFLRPVRFILSVKTAKRDFLVIASPEEINDYLDIIGRNKKNINLHIYSPKVTKNMPSFEDLRTPQISQKKLKDTWHASGSLINQLNLFAGQLYFRSYTAYLNTAEFLGLHTPELDVNIEQIFTDGFVDPRKRVLADGEKFKSPFKESPVPFLQGLLAMRRKGQRFHQSQVGRMVSGRLLQEYEFGAPDSEIEKLDMDDGCSVDDSDSGTKDAVEIKNESLSDAEGENLMDIDDPEDQEAHEDALGEDVSSDVEMSEAESAHGQ